MRLLPSNSNCFFCVYLLHFHGLMCTCEFCAHMSESHWLLLCLTVTACPIALSTNHIAPLQFSDLPGTEDVCILSSSHTTQSTYILHHMLSTEYTSGTGRTGFNIILILTEHARAALRPPSCSPQAVWALECVAQEHLISNWCTSSPMQPKPAAFSL